jgi:DNA (cytosine-5)-methyltransferase 1
LESDHTPVRVYYNEIDRRKAEWMRQLMRAGVIRKGIIDERSIATVKPADVAGFTQCHFFAGIGVWQYALRLADWPEAEEVWTGSCPCQPFSPVGKRKGKADPRHLWPAWFRQISERRPGVVFGEQVADGDGVDWLDHVQNDMESIGYRFGPCVLPAAGFGAPHGRHRLFFVADTCGGGLRPIAGEPDKKSSRGADGGNAGRRDGDGSMADSERKRTGKRAAAEPGGHRADNGVSRENGSSGSLGDTARGGRRKRGDETIAQRGGHADGEEQLSGVGNTDSAGSQILQCETIQGKGRPKERGTAVQPGPTSGFWADANWIDCIDGKKRAIEPGTFPLAHGAAARVLRLRGYGDAIVAQVAAAFIKTYLQVR